MVGNDNPPKVRRRRAIEGKKGKWVTIPKPKALSEVTIPAVANGTFTTIPVPVCIMAKTLECDVQRRWRLVCQCLLSRIHRAPTSQATLLIASLRFKNQSLVNSLSMLEQKHLTDKKEWDNHEAALYDEMRELEEALANS